VSADQNTPRPWLTCLDMEGVLVPEIWIAVAERTGIEELRLTTRDVADYAALMRHRIDVLDAHHLGLADIQAVIASIEPLPGARAFLDDLRTRQQVVILSDTFEQFAGPLMAQLGRPTILCHSLVVEDGRIRDWRMRLPDQKRASVAAFQALGYAVSAGGDSYNDGSMLCAAEVGVLFCPPPAVVAAFPQLPVTRTYDEFLGALLDGQDRTDRGASV